MKWIGQHIYDQISRFRNGVYLEDVSTGTITSGGNLGLDSNNKIVKATVSSGSGDIEGVTAGTNLSGGGTSGTVTLNLADASTSAKGAASFHSSDFDVDLGGVTLKAECIDFENLDRDLIQTSGESFVDNDTSIMTSAAIQDKIYGTTTVGTIGTGVWEGTTVASAYLDADTAHLSTQKQLTHHNFSADIDTTKYYIGFTEGDAESTSTGGSSIPIIAPTAGKLLKVFLRSNKNLHSLTFTWRLETQAGVNFGTGPSVVGTQSGVGCQNSTMTTYDFTTSLDSGDNLIDAGDAVYLSIQSGGTTASTKFYITCLWEWDLS